jgi:hypothetical protein
VHTTNLLHAIALRIHGANRALRSVAQSHSTEKVRTKKSFLVCLQKNSQCCLPTEKYQNAGIVIVAHQTYA